LPYQKTPINVTAEILSYTTGGGSLNVLYHLYKVQESAKKSGKYSEESKAELESAIMKFLTGMTIGAAATELARYGIIQPTLDPSQGESYQVRKFLEKGLPAGHVNLSGAKRWAPLYLKAQRMASQGKPLGEVNAMKKKAYEAAQWRAADVVSNLERTGSVGGIILINVNANKLLSNTPETGMLRARAAIAGLRTNLSTVSNFMLAQPYTQTISELANWLQGTRMVDSETFLSKLGETMTATVIPRTFSWWDQIKEENRPTYRGDTLEGQLRNKIQARLDSIGLDWVKLGKHRDELPKMLDFRGEERLRTPGGSLYVLGQKVSPEIWHIFGMGKIRKTSARGDIPINDATEAETMRLWRTLKNPRGRPFSQVIPKTPRPFLREKSPDGREMHYKLSPVQYDKYQKLVGEYRYSGMGAALTASVRAAQETFVAADTAAKADARNADKHRAVVAAKAALDKLSDEQKAARAKGGWMSGIDEYINSHAYAALGNDEAKADGIVKRLEHFTAIAKREFLKNNRNQLDKVLKARGMGIIYD
jgi:hypothetical protein